MSKFAVVIAVSTLVNYPDGRHTLDTFTDSRKNADRTAADAWDNWDRAFNAWLVSRAQTRSAMQADGWTYKPDEEDGDLNLRMVRDLRGEGGSYRERLYSASIIKLA